MAKVWVLDTETKGTGAQMVPLEKTLKQPASEPVRRRSRAVPKRKPRRREPEPAIAPQPQAAPAPQPVVVMA